MNAETRSQLTRSRRSLALDYERAMQANAELRRELQKCRHAKSQALSRLKRERGQRKLATTWMRHYEREYQEERDKSYRLSTALATPIRSWFKGLWTRRAQA